MLDISEKNTSSKIPVPRKFIGNNTLYNAPRRNFYRAKQSRAIIEGSTSRFYRRDASRAASAILGGIRE